MRSVNNITAGIFLFANCLLFGCKPIDSENGEKVKPKNIAADAFWIGGADGGNWYEIKSINSHRNFSRIAIYNDQDGSLIVDKNFMLVCNANKMTFITNLKEQISAFDGQKIYFGKSDSIDYYLQPVN